MAAFVVSGVGALGAPFVFVVLFPFLADEVLKVFDGAEDFVAFPLGPHEVVVAPVVEVAHRPPKALLERGPHQNRVVAPPDVVLVGRERGDGELGVEAVTFIDFDKKLAVVLLLQLQVLLLVFGVREVFNQLLDLGVQAFQRV